MWSHGDSEAILDAVTRAIMLPCGAWLSPARFPSFRNVYGPRQSFARVRARLLEWRQIARVSAAMQEISLED